MWNRNIESPRSTHARIGAAVVLALGSLTGAAFAQREPIPIEGAPVSDVRDNAGIFGPDAVRKAREKLVALERDTHVPVVVETIDTLGGEPLAEVARRHARREVGKGLLVLIAKREKKTEVLPTREYLALFPEPQIQAVLHAFNREFARDRLDEGLAQGVEEIATILARAKKDGQLNVAPANPSNTPQGTQPGSALVVRNKVGLTLEGARKLIAGAEAKATALGLKMNIAVVDDGGHLIAFARMDGARPASGYTAVTKATTAATFRQPTGPIKAPGSDIPDPLLNLSLQNAAAASGGKITTLYGGVPIVVDGQVTGGVGVGGGSGEQDAIVARAGIDEFLRDLQTRP